MTANANKASARDKIRLPRVIAMPGRNFAALRAPMKYAAVK